MTQARRSLCHDVTRWANAADDAIAKRDEAIVAMRADGASLREIAEAAGLSHGGVAKIINRRGLYAPRVAGRPCLCDFPHGTPHLSSDHQPAVIPPR